MVVNLKTGCRTVAPVATENINVKPPLQLPQVRDLRTHRIPERRDVLVEWSLSINWRVIDPYILLSRTLAMWLPFPVLVCWSKPKSPGNLIEVETLAGNAQ